MAATKNYESSNTSGSSATVYTWSAQAIGTAAADRLVIVGCSAAGGGVAGGTITAGSIGGNTATIDLGPISIVSPVIGFISLLVTTGTTADISFTVDNTKARAAISVWSANGSTVAKTSSNSNQQVSAASAAAAITVTSGGFLLAQTATGSVDIVGVDWTNATERNDLTPGAGTSRASGADGTATNTITSASNNAASVSWYLGVVAYNETGGAAAVGGGLTQGVLLDRRSLVA